MRILCFQFESATGYAESAECKCSFHLWLLGQFWEECFVCNPLVYNPLKSAANKHNSRWVIHGGVQKTWKPWCFCATWVIFGSNKISFIRLFIHSFVRSFGNCGGGGGDFKLVMIQSSLRFGLAASSPNLSESSLEGVIWGLAWLSPNPVPEGVWGGAPSNILAAKPPRGLGRSPNRRGPLPPPLWLRNW